GCDVVKARGCFGGVKQRVQKADVCPQRLVNARQQGCPQRCNSASTANHHLLAVHGHVVPSRWIGIPSYVRNATSRETIRCFRHLCALLIARQCKILADAATCCPFVRRKLVPNLLAADRCARNCQLRPAAAS